VVFTTFCLLLHLRELRSNIGDCFGNLDSNFP
jgi:hypothetical protein